MSETTGVSRRALLAGGAAATVAVCVPRADAAPRPTVRPGNLPLDRIGVTTFSVGDQATAIGYAKLFPKLAEIGYRAVEFSNFHGTPPEQVKRLLADNGLKGVGNKAAMDDASIDSALGAGLPWTGISVLNELYGTHTDAWKQTADDLNAFGKKCVDRGLKGFFVHMHGPEYLVVADNPGLRAIEVLLEYTDPRYVHWEMDVFWAYFFSSYVGGAGLLFDPVNYVLQNPKRFPFFHVKDGEAARQSAGGVTVTAMSPNASSGTFPMTDGICDVGQGHVPFKDFFGALAKVSPLKNHYFFWERDNASSAPQGSLTSARASYLMMAHDRLAEPKA